MSHGGGGDSTVHIGTTTAAASAGVTKGETNTTFMAEQEEKTLTNGVQIPSSAMLVGTTTTLLMNPGSTGASASPSAVIQPGVSAVGGGTTNTPTQSVRPYINMLPPSTFSPLSNAISPMAASIIMNSPFLSPATPALTSFSPNMHGSRSAHTGSHAMLPPAAAISPTTRSRSAMSTRGGAASTRFAPHGSSAAAAATVTQSLAGSIVSPVASSAPLVSSVGGPFLGGMDLIALKSQMMNVGVALDEIKSLKHELEQVRMRRDELEEFHALELQQIRVLEKSELRQMREMAQLREMFETLQTTHSGTVQQLSTLQTTHTSVVTQFNELAQRRGGTHTTNHAPAPAPVPAPVPSQSTDSEPSSSAPTPAPASTTAMAQSILDRMLPSMGDLHLIRQQKAAVETRLAAVESQLTSTQTKLRLSKEKILKMAETCSTALQEVHKQAERTKESARRHVVLNEKLMTLESTLRERDERIAELEAMIESRTTNTISGSSNNRGVGVSRTIFTGRAHPSSSIGAPAFASPPLASTKPTRRTRKATAAAATVQVEVDQVEQKSAADPMQELIEEQRRAQEEAIQKRAKEILGHASAPINEQENAHVATPSAATLPRPSASILSPDFSSSSSSASLSSPGMSSSLPASVVVTSAVPVPRDGAHGPLLALTVAKRRGRPPKTNTRNMTMMSDSPELVPKTSVRKRKLDDLIKGKWSTTGERLKQAATTAAEKKRRTRADTAQQAKHAAAVDHDETNKDGGAVAGGDVDGEIDFDSLFGAGHDDELDVADDAAVAAAAVRTAAVVDTSTNPPTSLPTVSSGVGLSAASQSLLTIAIAEEWIDRLEELDSNDDGSTAWSLEEGFQTHPLHLLLPLLCKRMVRVGGGAGDDHPTQDVSSSSSSSSSSNRSIMDDQRLCSSSLFNFFQQLFSRLLSTLEHIQSFEHCDVTILTLSKHTNKKIRKLIKQFRRMLEMVQTLWIDRERKTCEDEEEAMIETKQSSNSVHHRTSNETCTCVHMASSSSSSSVSPRIDLISSLQESFYTSLIQTHSVGETMSDAILECGRLEFLFHHPSIINIMDPNPIDSRSILFDRVEEFLIELLARRRIAPLHFFEFVMMNENEDEEEAMHQPYDRPFMRHTRTSSSSLHTSLVHTVLHQLLSPLPEEMLSIRAPALQHFLSYHGSPLSIDDVCHGLIDFIQKDSSSSSLRLPMLLIDLLSASIGPIQMVHLIETILLPAYHQAEEQSQDEQRKVKFEKIVMRAIKQIETTT